VPVGGVGGVGGVGPGELERHERPEHDRARERVREQGVTLLERPDEPPVVLDRRWCRRSETSSPPQAFGLLVVVGLFGFLVNTGVNLIERRVLRAWPPRATAR